MSMISPCINVCRMDPDTQLCRGCRRSMDEIARWAGMEERERNRIMKELHNRSHKKHEITEG
ncbi:MAG: DUF1289 domain-containing protein [Gammaproteobacteria bacterium]